MKQFFSLETHHWFILIWLLKILEGKSLLKENMSFKGLKEL